MTGQNSAQDHAVIVGAGVGGLVAAIECASQGLATSVLESRSTPGGKIRTVRVGGTDQDAGPSVFTMREVFDDTFDAANARLEDYLELAPVDLLARHTWSNRQSLDLFTNRERSVEAVAEFAGVAQAREFNRFCDDAQDLYQTLENTFMRAARPTVTSLTGRLMKTRPTGLLSMDPFSTLWSTLGKYFTDPRLRQLFGRYSTYCGSSPYQAPAILMLIAHAESRGVWQLRGGMYALVQALMKLGRKLGVQYRFDSKVEKLIITKHQLQAVELSSGERISCRHAVMNCDVNALALGYLGPEGARTTPRINPPDRSLSAITWNVKTCANGFDLAHHNVFFSDDYRAEFNDMLRDGRPPRDPTVYLCAQDRTQFDSIDRSSERLFCLVNAPANGDTQTYDTNLVASTQSGMLTQLSRSGLSLDIDKNATVITTPNDFARQYPGTGGALYGRATHGWRSSFARSGSATKIGGVYVAGGSAHPGAGVPMAAISGQLAARQLCTQLAGKSR